MPTIQDEIGVWNQLGTVTALPATWLKFPVISNGANGLFRATFTCSSFPRIHSYALIRSEFFTARTSQFTQALRVYPKPEIQTFEMPVPKDLMARNIYLRHIEVMKVFSRTKYVGVTSDIEWQLKLEEIW